MATSEQGRLTSAEARQGAGRASNAGHSSGAGHGSGDHLVKMANDIGNFFRSEPDRKEAIAGIANHMAKFWTPRMRQKLAAYLKDHGDAALDELPRAAFAALGSHPEAVRAKDPPGGDAG